MADAFSLRVLTPERQLYDETAVQVTAEGTLGQFGVLADHVTFLTSLEPGPLSFQRPAGGERTLAVKGGYAEVRDNVMTVLADDALPIEAIDAAKAKADRDCAAEELAKALAAHPFDHPERERAERELRWAEVRIALARA
ncbi:MAG: ATP synthase F1 subunit epsilon [Candidatus Binatia bacterium]